MENEVEEDSEKFVLPSDNLETLYEELSHRHCIEIPTQVLKLVLLGVEMKLINSKLKYFGNLC